VRMIKRRRFLKSSGTILAGLGLAPLISSCKNESPKSPIPVKEFDGNPIVLSTWNHGIPANDAAWKILSEQGRCVDAAEAGVHIVESDPEGQSVGIGGAPDRDGIVSLDACIMDDKGRAGAVCFLQNIMHPISVARRVMDKTPHVMLAGEGALAFAKSEGFEEINLLTPKSEAAWKEWLGTSKYEPIINRENHDTIGLICIDSAGNLSGACTTSGLAYKMHGRVGDSPIIGAGLFVDNEIGAATATGLGEVVMKTLGSFLIVELMRQGMSPQEACEEAVNRIVAKNNVADLQVGYLAINKQGETGAFSIHPGFNYALKTVDESKMVDSASLNA